MIRLLSIIGFLTCLAVGMILASKIPVEGTTYPDSTVPFAVVVATSIVFLILWRKSEQSSDYSAEQGSLNSNQVKHILKTSINTLETIHQKGIDNATLTRLETISLDIAKIIDSRISIQKDLGLESVSMLFCDLAYSERSINRGVSMLLDGYENKNEISELIRKAALQLKYTCEGMNSN